MEIFKGVLARDQLISMPNIQPRSLFICNLDNSDEPGSHWVAVLFTKSRVEYFDSYGLPPIFDDLKFFLLRYGTKLSYNSIQLQGMDTTMYGNYCIIFALLRARNFSLPTIVSTLMSVNDSHSRDHAVGTYINTAYDNLINAHGGISDIHVQGSQTLCSNSMLINKE